MSNYWGEAIIFLKGAQKAGLLEGGNKTVYRHVENPQIQMQEESIMGNVAIIPT